MNLKLNRSIASVVCFVWLCAAPARSEDKVTIGVSVPLTGTAAAYGTDIRNALVFANQRIANSKYELRIEDDRCSDKEAVAIAHKFIDVDKIRYVLGFGCSGTVLAAAPVYENAKVVVIASGTGAPAITNAGDYIFRTKPSLNLAADLLAREFAAKFKKVGAISEETAFCQGLTNAIVQSASKLGIEVVNENYLPETEDFRATILRLKAKGAEALFLNPQGEPGLINLFKQLKASAWDVPVYGIFTPGSPAFLRSVGNDADGIVYADLQFSREMFNERGRKLDEEFRKEFGEPMSAEHYSALTFLSFSALTEALESGKDVKQYLYDTRFENFVDGYSFDKNGDVVSDKLTYVLKTIRGGVVAPYR